jgi:conjugal transfer mating pair stabilization protein TraN
VDWSRVNLDEWLGILYETGHFPTLATLTLEDLTGAGSELAVETLGRPDADDRTARRAEGIDSEQVRMDAEGELWSGTLSTLPSP